MSSFKIASAAAGLALSGLLIAAPAAAAAQSGACNGPEGNARIWVNVDGVRSNDGLVAITVYADDRRRFLARRGSLYVVRVPARQGRTRACVNLPSTGIYGLAVYHDQDGDRSFDRNGVGLPAEAYGFSNNPRGLLGIPSFSRVRLSVPRTNMQTTITLTYP